MPKSKKPATKGGKKPAAPKKVVKAPAKKVSARVADQQVADKMRADAFAAANPVRQTVEEQYNADLQAEIDAYRQRVADHEAAWAKYMDSLDSAPSPPPKKKSLLARWRSAVTGLFVKKSYADANPTTTVKERAE